MPSTHAATRRETEVLRSVRLIVALVDPSGDGGTAGREQAIRRLHEAAVAAGHDPDGDRGFCEHTLESIIRRVVDFEHRTGMEIDVAFTAAEHEALLRLVQLFVTQPA